MCERREKKIEIRVCKTKDNRFTVDDFAALADERTRIIVMSTLEWCNGWASDMKPSVISARKRDLPGGGCGAAVGRHQD